MADEDAVLRLWSSPFTKTRTGPLTGTDAQVYTQFVAGDTSDVVPLPTVTAAPKFDWPAYPADAPKNQFTVWLCTMRWLEVPL